MFQFTDDQIYFATMLVFSFLLLTYCTMSYCFFASNILTQMIGEQWTYRLALGYSVFVSLLQHISLHLRLGLGKTDFRFAFTMMAVFFLTAIFLFASCTFFLIIIQDPVRNKYSRTISKDTVKNYTIATYMGYSIVLFLLLNTGLYAYRGIKRYREYVIQQRINEYNLRILYTLHGKK